MFNFNKEIRSLINLVASTFRCNSHCDFANDFWIDIEIIKEEIESYDTDLFIIYESIKNINNNINKNIDFIEVLKIIKNKNQYNIFLADVRLIKLKIMLIIEEIEAEKKVELNETDKDNPKKDK